MSLGITNHGATSSHPVQYDAAWIHDYRDAVALNILGMFTATSFASAQERAECDRLIACARRMEPGAQEALELALAHGRERALLDAVENKQRPSFEYPLIFLDELQQHIAALRDLEVRIRQQETTAVVRRFYLGDPAQNEQGAIPYHIHYLQILEATASRESKGFWEHNLAINPLPQVTEMQYALSRVKWFIEQGKKNVYARAVSESLTRFFEERLLLPLSNIPDTEELKGCPLPDVSLYGGKPSVAPPSPLVSAEAVRLFFETMLHDQGCFQWRVLLDYAALTTRLEPGMRAYVLAGVPYPTHKVVELIAHEWLGHLSPRILGEQSPLGLLGIGTGGSLPIEEGVGLYYEWELAKSRHRRYDESRIWLGPLATGLATGVLVPPQDFFAFYTFFEQFLLLYRLIWRADEDLPVAQEKARVLARNRWLRVDRGVPFNAPVGVCYTKDAHYAGFFRVHQAVEQDPSVLDWLASGVLALEQIGDLQALGMSPAVRSPRALLDRPDLEAYILSFEQEKSSLESRVG